MVAQPVPHCQVWFAWSNNIWNVLPEHSNVVCALKMYNIVTNVLLEHSIALFIVDNVILERLTVLCIINNALLEHSDAWRVPRV